MTNLQLSNLIRKVAEGNEDAFNTLYRETAKKVFTASLYIVKNRAAAEDVTQDVFISLIGNARKFVYSANAMGWLLTISRNRSLNWLRREKNLSSLDALENWDIPADGQSPENILVIKEALSRLSDEEKRYVYLYYVNGLTVREIAELTGRPKSSVHYTLSLCQKKLADVFPNKKK